MGETNQELSLEEVEALSQKAAQVDTLSTKLVETEKALQVQAAEFAAKLRAARAEHDGNVDASADSQIASSAARHRLDGQNVSGAGMRAPPGRDSASCDLCFDARAGERKCHIPAEAEPEREHRDFDSGGVLVVAEQDVAGTQRDIIHCP